MATALRAEMVRAAKRQLKKPGYGGIAASIRYATTFTPGCTAAEMVAAGKELGLNPITVRRQFAQARKEDAEIDKLCKGMTEQQFIDVVVRCVLRK